MNLARTLFACDIFNFIVDTMPFSAILGHPQGHLASIELIPELSGTPPAVGGWCEEAIYSVISTRGVACVNTNTPTHIEVATCSGREHTNEQDYRRTEVMCGIYWLLFFDFSWVTQPGRFLQLLASVPLIPSHLSSAS